MRYKYKIRIIWQVPNSPDIYELDLGALCAVQSDVKGIHRTLVIVNEVLATLVEQEFANLDKAKLHNIFLKNSGRNDLMEKCWGKVDPDNVAEFVLLLDQKDSILLGDPPHVKDNSEDDMDTESDSEDNDDDSTETEGSTYKVSIDASNGSLDRGGDELEVTVADAVLEVGVKGHYSVQFLENSILFTSNKTVQICLLLLSGNLE